MVDHRQPSTTVQQTKQSNEPPAYIQPYLQKGIQDLTALYDKGQAPGYYPGATVAAPSANTQAALSALYERGVKGSPYGKSIMANLNETMGGKYLDVDANPYFQKALAAGFKPQTEQFMQEVLPGLEGRFALSGRYGSGAHTGTTDRAVNSLNRAQADAAAKASSSAYDAERSRMLGAAGTAAGLFPQLQAADYQDIEAMGQAGAGWDRQNQARIDADIARYNYDTNKDWNYINRYLASLNAGLSRRRDERHGARLGDAGDQSVGGYVEHDTQRRRRRAVGSGHVRRLRQTPQGRHHAGRRAQ